ncbi:hypothetical protein [Vibrio breoganii]|uniref:hypothetical protein n=1 Tax=Vibrio breoganii TaxID=553239 RepID=UPI000C818DF7|nr:hypothetical protein [Vibrio breoganii]PML13629.1 hypothetical protein BCT84_12900 [Vibrio breoganii]
MFKKTLIASLLASGLMGCATSGEDIATLDRNQLSQELTQACDELGNEYTPVSVVVDTASEAMVSIQERQCSVFQSYRVLASEHADVAGFLEVNARATDEELIAAMTEFDADKAEEKKIAPRVAAYKSASESIFDSNVQLATDIAIQGAKIGFIVSENATVLAQESGAAMFSNLLASVSVDEEEEAEDVVPIVAAYKELTVRSELAYDANSIISFDQSTIEQLENLDKVIAEQVQ